MRILKALAVFTFLGSAAAATVVYLYGSENVHNFISAKISKRKSTEDVVEKIAQSRPVKVEAGDKLEMVAIKNERVLYVYKAEQGSARLELLRAFPFKGFSGTIGPKLREGDGQIPEGIYGVNFLNPNSKYHLSFRITYPNEFERQKGREDGRDTNNLGSNIMIHGGSATIGCIPIGNDEIEELFAWVATVKKENVRVVIAPSNLLNASAESVVKTASAPKWYPELLYDIKMEMLNMRNRGADF